MIQPPGTMWGGCGVKEGKFHNHKEIPSSLLVIWVYKCYLSIPIHFPHRLCPFSPIHAKSSQTLLVFLPLSFQSIFYLAKPLINMSIKSGNHAWQVGSGNEIHKENKVLFKRQKEGLFQGTYFHNSCTIP